MVAIETPVATSSNINNHRRPTLRRATTAMKTANSR